MANLFANAKLHFDANAGGPLAGGLLYTYSAGTNTPLTTWQDSAGTVANANPIVLDARGECTCYGSGTYKFVLRDSLGTLIWSQDNVWTAAAGSASSTTFTALGTATVLDTIFTTTGYATAGDGGRGFYISDPLANAALAAAYPRACKADAAGKYFRLLPDAASMIGVAQMGAFGFASTGYTNATIATPLLAAIDERPIIQAAFDYAKNIGAKYVRLTARHYAGNRQVPTAGGTVYTNESGLFLVTDGVGLWSDAPCQIWRRKASGAIYDATDFTAGSFGFGEWRGGALYCRGQGVATGIDPTIGSVDIYNVMFEGGALYGDRAGYQDTSDKGLWQSNDRNAGHLYLRGKSGFRGYLGELVYTSAISPAEAARRFLVIEDDVVLSESNLSALNPNGPTCRVGRCYAYNCFLGIEGWTGDAGGYIRMIIENCIGGSALQCGVYNTVGGFNFFKEARVGIYPTGLLDMIMIKSGISLGDGLSGRITAIDCTISISDGVAFTNGSRDNDLEIISICNSVGLISAVFVGGASCRGNTIRVRCERTKRAEDGGFTHVYQVTYGGLFATGNAFHLGPGYGAVRATNASFAITGIEPRWLDYRYRAGDVGAYYDAEANNNATIDLRAKGPLVALSCGAAATGVKKVNLDITNIDAGHELTIANFTNSFISGGVPVQIGNLRQLTPLILGPGYVTCRVRFDGAFWEVLEAPPPVLTPGTLVDAVTVTPDFRLRDFEWTIGGNRTLANPTDANAGQTGTIRIRQDATGGRIIAYGANWRFPGGSAASGVLSVAANAYDEIRYTVQADGTITAVLDKALGA